ncbi:MAG: sulfoquinovosidase, partial [Thermoleophilaceae bacterium]|nr:sulfoquinovosidase [Thermoleophilaceae bacterium]
MWSPCTIGVAIVALLACATAGPATAAVTIGPDQIVVTGTAARATITRSPFHIAFADGGDHEVLSQVANSGQAPAPVPPLPDPAPGGSQNATAPTLYAPFSFLVGAGAFAQFPLYQYEGNLLTGTQGGTLYSARDVEQAVPDGDGVKLTVGTSDPTGRKLAVTVAPQGATVRVSAAATPDTGVISMSDSFASPPGEAFRGFGGRHNSIDQRGSDFFNWLQQENTGAGQLEPVVSPLPGTGGDTYHFPNGPTAAYYVQSQFVSPGRYGFMLDRSELSRWRMDSDRGDAWQTAVAAPAIDYVVAPGGSQAASSTLTSIGGRHPVPPSWALGPQLDRAVKYPSDNATDYKAAVLQDIRDIDRYKLPLTGYRIEGWEFLSRDDLRQIIAMLHQRGIHALVYFRTFVGRDNIGTDSPARYDEALAKGYVAKNRAGQPYVFVSNFNNLGAVIDFTNPEAVRWWQGRIREALDLGADGFMQDFGEQVQQDMVFSNGETGLTMHNKFPILSSRATADLVREYRQEHPDREIYYYTRTGYSGQPGAAGFEFANFPGDETTDFSRSTGLASATTDMLNRQVGGLFGYTTDIGGYFDVGPYSPTTKELFLRWAEWAALSPLFRLHGSVSAGTHTPWSFDAETVRLYNDLSRLHIAAEGLIRRLWTEGVRTGTPPVRPLWLAYPDDSEAAKQDQEWLLGPDVLVAPVVAQGAVDRSVYFPAGCWQAPDTGERHSGPSSAVVP